MGPDDSRLSVEERSRLVAYLDGELDGAEAKRFAADLARNPDLRRELEAMRATWNLLDHLPRARASEDFGSKTLTVVSRLDFPVVAERPPARDGLSWIAAVAGVAVIGSALGFAAMRSAWPDPNARLVSQLPLAEHLDEYRDVQDFEFLRRLDESDLFDDAE